MKMHQHEIEALVEDLVEDTIIEFFETNFYTKKQADYAFEVLKEKLEEFNTEVFDDLFD